MEERSNRIPFSGQPIHNERAENRRIGMRVDICRTASSFRVDHVYIVTECAVAGHGPPVAKRFPLHRGLRLQVARELRKRVALPISGLVVDLFITPGKHNWLEE